MNSVLFSHNSDEWYTPIDLFSDLNSKYHFNLDPCASLDSSLCPINYNKIDDGLSKEWFGNVFCNPPYSDIKRWVQKCFYENFLNDCFICLLVPVRSDTKWFHDYIYKNSRCCIQFIKGRLHFSDSKNCCPFPCMLVYFLNSVHFTSFDVEGVYYIEKK